MTQPTMPGDGATEPAPIPATAPPPREEEMPASARQKGAATVRRHAEERRAERMTEIHAQIADGTLVVRYMTEAQRLAASEAVRETAAGNRPRSARAPRL